MCLWIRRKVLKIFNEFGFNMVHKKMIRAAKKYFVHLPRLHVTRQSTLNRNRKYVVACPGLIWLTGPTLSAFLFYICPWEFVYQQINYDCCIVQCLKVSVTFHSKTFTYSHQHCMWWEWLMQIQYTNMMQINIFKRSINTFSFYSTTKYRKKNFPFITINCATENKCGYHAIYSIILLKALIS